MTSAAGTDASQYPASSTSLAHSMSSPIGVCRNGCRDQTDRRMQEHTLSNAQRSSCAIGSSASSSALSATAIVRAAVDDAIHRSR
jgi:hypothetical protein